MAELNENMTNVSEDVSHAVHSAVDFGKEVLQDAADRLGEGTSRGAEKLRSAADSVKRQTREATHSVENQIRNHPLAALAVAFGVGLIVGKLMDHSGSRRW